MLSASGWSSLTAAVVACHVPSRPRPTSSSMAVMHSRGTVRGGGAWASAPSHRRHHHERRLHHRLGGRRRAVRCSAAEKNGVGTAEEEEEEGEDGGPAPPSWSKEVNTSNVVSVPVDAPMTDEPAAVWFVPNFLDDDDAKAVAEGCDKLRKKFKRDHSFAVGRLSALARKHHHIRGRGGGRGTTRLRL